MSLNANQFTTDKVRLSYVHLKTFLLGAECKGHWVFTAGNKNPVPIVDIGQNPVVNAGDIYSGMYARVCVSFYAYNFSGKRGIGCGLEAVQKLEDGEPCPEHCCGAD